jgi:hypothetical protein
MVPNNTRRSKVRRRKRLMLLIPLRRRIKNMRVLRPHIMIPMPIQQVIPNLRLYRRFRRSRILISVTLCLRLIPPRSRSLALRIHIRHKQKVQRVRSPDRTIRLRLQRRHSPPRPHRPRILKPLRNKNLPHPTVIRSRIHHPLPIRRKPPTRLPTPRSHLPLRTTTQRNRPQMIHLRILLQRHIRNRKQHPLPTRRKLRIHHTLHRHQILKRHRSLAGIRLPRIRLPHSRRNHPRHQPNRHNRPSSHRASLRPNPSVQPFVPNPRLSCEK